MQFSEFIIANVRLNALRNDRRLSTHAVAHFTRRELATALRRVIESQQGTCCSALSSPSFGRLHRASEVRCAFASAAIMRSDMPTDTRLISLQNPYQTNLLVAGYDEDEGASLYWLDYLATMHKMNIAGTGYGEQPAQFNASALPAIHSLTECSQTLARYWLVARLLSSAAHLFFVPTTGSYFVLSLCDRLWHPDMTEAEALELMEKV